MVEPVCKVLEKVDCPFVAVRVPVKFALDEIVCPLISPAVKTVAKRLVEEAVVAKKLVVVALVEVEFSAVKFWRVDEASDRKPPVRVERPETLSELRVPTLVREEAKTFEARVAPVSVPAGAEPVIFPVRFPVAVVKKRFVVEAFVAKKLVVVAEVPVAVVKVKA